MAHQLDIQRALETPLESMPADELFESWAETALEHAQNLPCWHAGWNALQLTLRIVEKAEGASLNEAYCHKQGPTNVLSFPFEQPELVQPPLLGDIVICAPLVEEEARAQHKDATAHWAHLFVHGILHLLGYDHQDDEQATEMEGAEREILQQLGFPDPYHTDFDARSCVNGD